MSKASVDSARSSTATPTLVIAARWVVPVAPAGVVLEDHAVVVQAGRIAAIRPSALAAVEFPAAHRIDLPRHALIPGLVNAHTHAAMALLRGIADDLPLMVWLKEHIWPAELRHISPEFVYDGTLLACAEMLRAGITCANDMYFFPEAAAQAFLDAGMRASIGIIAVDFPSSYAADPDDYLAKGLALRDRLAGAERLSFCMAPHAPYTAGDATLRRIATLAEELDLPVHIHVHETADEIKAGIESHGVRPLQRLETLGLVTERLIGVHAVHLTAAEIALLARAGSTIVHCPSSNLKLASGFAPAAALLEHGVHLALGTDGAASNNRLDILQEMRTAALLAKAVSGNAAALPATTALHCATLGGAHALGLGAAIGSIEPGKLADLCAVSLGDPEMQPCYDALSHLVYACSREHVTHVWVAGELVVENRVLCHFDFPQLENRISMWQNRLRSKNG